MYNSILGSNFELHVYTLLVELSLGWEKLGGRDKELGRGWGGGSSLKNKTKIVLTIFSQQFPGVSKYLSLHKGRWWAAHTRTGILTVHIKDHNVIAT